jgi:uncharacterized protein
MGLLKRYSYRVTIQASANGPVPAPDCNYPAMLLGSYVHFVLLVVAAMIFSGCSIQNRLLYFPSPGLPTTEALNAVQLKPWPAASMVDYRGLVASQGAKYENGTVVVFHGNGGTAAGRVFYVQMLTALRYRVILAEYPGYGGRKGNLGEKAFVADALKTVQLAFAQFGEPFFILGESLGCGVAAAVAGNASVKIEGIVLVTPWDTLASIARSKFPFLPVRLILTDTYDNIENLQSFSGRIAVVGAGRDEVVPVRHASNLYRSLTTTAKRMWLIDEAGHNDVSLHTDQTLWQEIMNFAGGEGKE